MNSNTTSLDTLKLLLGISGSSLDTYLSAILDMAESEFLSITHRSEAPTSATNVIIRMAMARYNHVKDEGYTSTSFSGISEIFGGYDKDLTNAINGFRKAVML